MQNNHNHQHKQHFQGLEKLMQGHLSSARLFVLSALLIFLTACSSSSTPTTTVTTDAESSFHSIASVEITASTSINELEQQYGGTVILHRPAAGFAVLGFSEQEGQFTTLSTTTNQDVIASPEAQASGFDSWAGGFDSWAGGFDSWAGGFDAWGGGFDAWGGGNASAPAPPGSNSTLWQQIKLNEAHQVTNNYGEGVVVAVIDTGLDLAHPIFTDRLAPSWMWKDYIDNDNYPQEAGDGSDNGFGHGTAVAGIIAQIAPKATILPLRVLERDGMGDLDDVISAIDWAVSQGADIINLSLGAYEHYWPLDMVLEYAVSEKVMVVTSAGNDGTQQATYPSHMSWWAQFQPYLYGIGSVGSDNSISDFSNYGNVITNAPGENIVTAYPGEKLTKATGTSFAAPVMTGALALAFGDYHLDDPYSLFIYLGNTGKWAPGFSSWAYGLVDVYDLVMSAQGQPYYNLMAESWLNNFTMWDWQNNAVITSEGWDHSGAKMNGVGGFGQTVQGLRPNTTYTFSGYLRVEGGGSIAIGVKNYGGPDTYRTAYNSYWTYKEITFTTGPSDTSVELVIWNNHNTTGYADAFYLSR